MRVNVFGEVGARSFIHTTYTVSETASWRGEYIQVGHSNLELSESIIQGG